jgi:hypothetical protein
MRTIYEGKAYDTETAERIAEFRSPPEEAEEISYVQALYRTKKGAWFLHGIGGSGTTYARNTGGQFVAGEMLEPLMWYEAKAWAIAHAPEVYAAYFLPDEPAPARAPYRNRVDGRQLDTEAADLLWTHAMTHATVRLYQQPKASVSVPVDERMNRRIDQIQEGRTEPLEPRPEPTWERSIYYLIGEAERGYWPGLSGMMDNGEACLLHETEAERWLEQNAPAEVYERHFFAEEG